MEVGLESNQVGKLVQTTFVQIVVEVNKQEDPAHFAPAGNLEEVFHLHRQYVMVPNMPADSVAARSLRLHLLVFHIEDSLLVCVMAKVVNRNLCISWLLSHKVIISLITNLYSNQRTTCMLVSYLLLNGLLVYCLLP